MTRKALPARHTLDVAIACLKQDKRCNSVLIEEMEKIAAEYKGRDRVYDAHKERERVKAQRELWAALPEFGPGFAAVEVLKKAIIDRAWRLLDIGEFAACDALLEFVPDADANAMLNEYFREEE